MANKILLGIGGVLLLAGAIMSVMGFMGAGDAVADLGNSSFDDMDATSGTLEYADDDGEGEFGFGFFIRGELIDADENGEWDDCEAFAESNNITVTRDGGNGSNEFKFTCDYDKDEQEANPDGTLIVGFACSFGSNCTNGTYSWESTSPVHSMYIDKALERFFRSLGDSFVSGLTGIAGFGVMCCGIPFLIIGAFVGGGSKQQQQVNYVAVNQPTEVAAPQTLGASSDNSGTDSVTSSPFDE